MLIENHTLIIDDQTIDLPHLPVRATVKVWRVPTEYRANGVFISVTPQSGIEEVPACANPEFVGQAELEPHPDAVLDHEKQLAVQEIKRQAASAIEALAWRIERAEERDRLGVPGETVQDVLREREAIRRASNRLEAEIHAAETVEAVKAVQWSVTEADDPTPARLTRLEFLRRFTDAEMQSIVAAADANPALKAALMKWQTAEGIVLTDALTIAGVQALEMIGLIGTGRASEILAL